MSERWVGAVSERWMRKRGKEGEERGWRNKVEEWREREKDGGEAVGRERKEPGRQEDEM